MKLIAFTTLVLMAFVACNNKSSDSNTTVAAPPPPPSNQCVMNTTNPYGNYNGYSNVNPGVCSNQVYSNYTNYGFMPYPYTNWNSYYYNNYSYIPLCDCPANYRPVYHGYIGMGCVAIQYFNPIAVGVYYWSLTPNNYQWVNISQVSNITNTIGNQTNCYQNVAQACYTDQANSCGAGYVCRSTAGGSRLGICAQQ